MKITNSKVFNLENALRGMRNPKSSWDRIDSRFGLYPNDRAQLVIEDMAKQWHTDDPTRTIKEYEEYLIKNGIMATERNCTEVALIGPKDRKLATSLCAAGPEHRKFLRQIFVTFDLTAPLYVYKEFDTYKINTTANSTSTMHKIQSSPIDMDKFELDDYDAQYAPVGLKNFIQSLEDMRINYNELVAAAKIEENKEKKLAILKKAKKIWKELIRWLPEGWTQTRTITLNYEVLANIYHQRKNHKLTEWHYICRWIESLPYAKELIIGKN